MSRFCEDARVLVARLAQRVLELEKRLAALEADERTKQAKPREGT